MKICIVCKINKETIDFNKDKREKDGFNAICRYCINERRSCTKHLVLVESKLCKKCNIEKDAKDFKIQKENSDGLYHMCKLCFNEWRKEYRKREYVKINEKNFRFQNKSYYDQYDREWRDVNKEKVKEYQKKSNNKEKRKEYQREYKKKNSKIRRKNDIVFRLSGNIRNYLRMIITRNYKKSRSSTDIIGCSYADLKSYIESKFESWMNWDNYGKYNGQLNYGWDIDHIVPLSSATTEEELVKLNHFSNLQPLCSYTNRYIKRNQLDEPFKKI
jgi:hypothetical protein